VATIATGRSAFGRSSPALRHRGALAIAALMLSGRPRHRRGAAAIGAL